MRKKNFIMVVVFFLIVISCAVITVNIYFPEKDVKEAYKALEKELMTPGKVDKDRPKESEPGGKPESSLRFELVRLVYAQEAGLSEKIAEIIKRMPEVVNAYREMGKRLAQMDRLRDSGAVGEGNNGMIVVREERLLTGEDRRLIAMENENRRTVINGMARAIIRINRVPENEGNINQVMPQAVRQFADLRRDAAKKGWWIQDQYGNWNRK